MYEITVEDEFAAAHYLRKYKGKCERMHGHNYKVVVVVNVGKLDKIGLSVDFKVIKGKLNNIIKQFDHTVIDKHEYFKRNNPSAENIAKYIFDRLKEIFNNNNTRIHKVCVWETSRSCAAYVE